MSENHTCCGCCGGRCKKHEPFGWKKFSQYEPPKNVPLCVCSQYGHYFKCVFEYVDGFEMWRILGHIDATSTTLTEDCAADSVSGESLEIGRREQFENPRLKLVFTRHFDDGTTCASMHFCAFWQRFPATIEDVPPTQENTFLGKLLARIISVFEWADKCRYRDDLRRYIEKENEKENEKRSEYIQRLKELNKRPFSFEQITINNQPTEKNKMSVSDELDDKCSESLDRLTLANLELRRLKEHYENTQEYLDKLRDVMKRIEELKLECVENLRNRSKFTVVQWVAGVKVSKMYDDFMAMTRKESR